MEPIRKELNGYVFIGNRLISPISAEKRNYTPDGWYSRAFFCYTCGEIWARIAFEGHDYYCQLGQCEQHRGIREGGGSLTEFCADLYPFWPVEVLNREIALWAEQEPELWY